MSLHYYDCLHRGRKVRVVLGYDRPLREIFMRVQRLDLEGQPRLSFLYTSVNDMNGPGDLPYYASKLEALGIKVPDCLFEAVWEDAINQTGNLIVEHYADNTYRTIHDERAIVINLTHQVES